MRNEFIKKRGLDLKRRLAKLQKAHTTAVVAMRVAMRATRK